MSWADSSSSAGAPSPAAASSASGAASSPGGPAALKVLPTCSWPPICNEDRPGHLEDPLGSETGATSLQRSQDALPCTQLVPAMPASACLQRCQLIASRLSSVLTWWGVHNSAKVYRPTDLFLNQVRGLRLDGGLPAGIRRAWLHALCAVIARLWARHCHQQQVSKRHHASCLSNQYLSGRREDAQF